MKKKIATYGEATVYVMYLSRTGHFALISFNKDGSKMFKVDINDIKDVRDEEEEK